MMEIGLDASRGGSIDAEYVCRKTRLEPFRVVEIVLSLLALVALLPLLALIAALVAGGSRGPILYRQERLGRNGETFGCLKFRSMVQDADTRLAILLARDETARMEWEHHRKLRRDPRITPLGGFLRRSSLDELPQLLNVLRGEMSLVGPRPIVRDEARYYGRYMADYTRVRPGISGLWQISGRSNTSYRRRVACDVLYVRRKSFRLDLVITLMTIPAVLASRGAR